jgi:hypothetical protein
MIMDWGDFSLTTGEMTDSVGDGGEGDDFLWPLKIPSEKMGHESFTGK